MRSTSASLAAALLLCAPEGLHAVPPGAAIGEAPCTDRVCIWRDVALRPGANGAVVTASINGVQVTGKAVVAAIEVTK